MELQIRPLEKGRKFPAISKIFKPNFVCLLTNERYKTYKKIFFLVSWVMPQGWDLGVLGVKNKFSEDGHMAYQIEGDDQ